MQGGNRCLTTSATRPVSTRPYARQTRAGWQQTGRKAPSSAQCSTPWAPSTTRWCSTESVEVPVQYPDVKTFRPEDVANALKAGWKYLPGYPYAEPARVGAAIPLIKEV
nr:MAG TPA: hypothetical protein [Caudoviricetes sp.]